MHVFLHSLKKEISMRVWYVCARKPGTLYNKTATVPVPPGGSSRMWGHMERQLDSSMSVMIRVLQGLPEIQRKESQSRSEAIDNTFHQEWHFRIKRVEKLARESWREGQGSEDREAKYYSQLENAGSIIRKKECHTSTYVYKVTCMWLESRVEGLRR